MNILKFTVVMLISVSMTTPAKSQINVGPIVNVVLKKTGTFNPEDLKALQRTTTIFLIGTELDSVEVNTWKSALTSGWSFTPLELMTFEEFAELEDHTGYSFFTVDGRSVFSGSSSSTHIYLTLSMMQGKKRLDFCRIELFEDYPSYKIIYEDIWMKSKKFLKHIYNDCKIYNWSPGMIKNQIQVVNTCLEASEQRWIFGEEITTELSKLKKATLYIPNYCFIDYNKWNGDESKTFDPDELLKEYQYKYESISEEDLSDRILSDDETIYYLRYVRSSTDKYFTIVNGKTGKIIYTTYGAGSYNLKDKDFKKLQKEIDKL